MIYVIFTIINLASGTIEYQFKQNTPFETLEQCQQAISKETLSFTNEHGQPVTFKAVCVAGEKK